MLEVARAGKTWAELAADNALVLFNPAPVT